MGQVSITEVHMRYEDNRDPEHPFAIELSMENILLQNVDQQWQPTYISDVTKIKEVTPSPQLPPPKCPLHHATHHTET